MITEETLKKFLYEKASHLAMEISAGRMEDFFYLLQSGFILKAQVGCSVESFFCDQLKLSRQYVEERIQGVFLNGKPVDNIASAMIKNGARLTLSAAMPGLVGVALRRGILASFRQSITHREEGGVVQPGSGIIRLKLFNLLLKELGPGFLNGGIYLLPEELRAFLARQSDEFWRDCRAVRVDASRVTPEVFQEKQWLADVGLIKLSMTTV